MKRPETKDYPQMQKGAALTHQTVLYLQNQNEYIDYLLSKLFDLKLNKTIDAHPNLVICNECNYAETMVRPGKTQCDNSECKLNQ